MPDRGAPSSHINIYTICAQLKDVAADGQKLLYKWLVFERENYSMHSMWRWWSPASPHTRKYLAHSKCAFYKRMFVSGAISFSEQIIDRVTASVLVLVTHIIRTLANI